MMTQAFVLVMAAAAVAPTAQDIDWARGASMPGNFTHCVRFKQLRCKSVADFDERYSCSFREYTNNGPWPKRQIVVEKLKGTWTKISGDTPTCAVMDLNTEPTQGKM